jgi:hypothetical protein
MEGAYEFFDPQTGDSPLDALPCRVENNTRKHVWVIILQKQSSMSVAHHVLAYCGE